MNADKLRNLLKLLAYQVGQQVSLTELGAQLQMSKNTVASYIDLLEQSFVVFRLKGFNIADLTHIPAITAIYAEAAVHGTASWELDPPDTAEMARRMADIQARGYPYLVALAGGEVAGYTYASAYRPRPGYRFTVEDSV